MNISLSALEILAAIDVSGLPRPPANQARIDTALAITFGITGAIALLIITLAGFRYITSQGNPSETAKAKNAIIYAGIGLAVSILAYSIITFVVRSVT